MNESKNNFDLRDKCNLIVGRYLDSLPAYISSDRKEKATVLLNLAYEITKKGLEESKDTSVLGSTSIGASLGASIGGMLGPLGMIAGGLGGAVMGKSMKSVKSFLKGDDIIDDIRNDDLKFLFKNSKLSVDLIADHIINILYPQRLNSLDVRMLLAIADTPDKAIIETINCDLGIISEIECYSNRFCVPNTTDFTNFEKDLVNLKKKACHLFDNGATLKIVMAESLSYCDLRLNPKIRDINDIDRFRTLVNRLRPGQKLIAIVPSLMLYNPGMQRVRKELFTSGQLMAIMDLKQSDSNSRIELSAMVFCGDNSERIALLSSTWNYALKGAFGQRISEQQLRAAIQSGLKPDRTKELYSIPYSNLCVPFIVTPSYQSTKKNAKYFVELDKVVALEQQHVFPDSKVTGVMLSIADLSKDKPLRPINKELLEVEELENCSKWYKIQTDNVVFLYIWNGVVFTGYMEDVKGENFFFRGPELNRVIVLGLQKDSSITPQYLAQILQSKKYCIRQQLLGADYYTDKLLPVFKETILKTYIPQLSHAGQYKTIADTTQQQLEQKNLEEKRKFDEYHYSIRGRKHALSQEFLRFEGYIIGLIDYCKDCGTEFDIKKNIRENFTVEDLINNIRDSLPEIGDMITNIAEIDWNFGAPEKIDVIEELRKYSKNWLSYGIEVNAEEFFCPPRKSDNIYIEFPLRALQQIFSNIFYNALTHGFGDNQPKKIIQIRWNLDGDMVVIRIANNGLPLKKSPYGYFTKTHVRNYQQKGGHRSEGIGNLQCKKLIEEFGGEISLKEIDEKEFKVAYILKFKLKQD